MDISKNMKAARAVALGAIALATAFSAGCGASGGGTSVGSYTGSGSLTMSLSGTVVDQNGGPLPGYSVSINNSQPVVTDRTGSYTINIPTVQINTTGNTIKVYNTSDTLAYTRVSGIDTEICVQTLQPIVIGPPLPPGIP